MGAKVDEEQHKKAIVLRRLKGLLGQANDLRESVKALMEFDGGDNHYALFMIDDHSSSLLWDIDIAVACVEDGLSHG